MITWPIFLALILAYFAVKYTINMEEEAEKKEARAKEEMDSNSVENEVENSEET